MYKIILFLVMSSMLISCEQTPIENGNIDYTIGDTGPGGGIVFYDCDADNIGDANPGIDGLISTSVGWRYLEAAPHDVTAYVDPVSGSTVTGVSTLELPADYYFGYHRASESGSCLYVNDTDRFNSSNCTKFGIGSGLENTNLITAAYGNSTYTWASGWNETPLYAAKVCSDLQYGGKNDWFLPSRDELLELYSKRSFFTPFMQTNYGYHSSSEYYPDDTDSAGLYSYFVNFANGMATHDFKNEKGFIRPIRRFM